jgi:hypothetical protein
MAGEEQLFASIQRRILLGIILSGLSPTAAGRPKENPLVRYIAPTGQD